MDNFFNITIESVIMFLCFIPAIVVHEVSHGFMANRLGDPTAKEKGRLSFNPLKHIDPFGTVLLPIVLALSGGPVFGYAKPVPYNPRYFKNIRMGEFLTGMAGPASNFIMALLGIVVGNIIIHNGLFTTDVGYWTVTVSLYFTLINLCLAFFNLIPLPPLDGSSIIAFFLNDNALRQYYRIQRYSLPILLVILFLVPLITGFNIIGEYLNLTAINITLWAFGG